MRIESGNGNGLFAAVDNNNRLATSSVSYDRQHIVSKLDNKAFQVIGSASIASGTENVLHVINDTVDQTLTTTFIRVQVITDATVPVVGEYFEIGDGLTYSSGGTVASPVNMYIGSSISSGATCYQDNPTLTGTFVPTDRHYTRANGDQETYNKRGALIVPPGQAFTVRYTGTGTGIAYSRVSFYVSPVNSLDV